MNTDKNGQICVNKGILFVLLAVLVVGFAVMVSRTNLLSTFSQAASRRNLVDLDGACANTTSGYYQSSYNANSALAGGPEYCFKYTIVGATATRPKFCSRTGPQNMRYCNATAVTQLSQADIISGNSYCANIKGQVGRNISSTDGIIYCQKFNGGTYTTVDLTDGKRKTTVNPQVNAGPGDNAFYCTLEGKLYMGNQCSTTPSPTPFPFADRPVLATLCQSYKGVVGGIDPINIARQFSGEVNYLAYNPNVTELYSVGDNLKYCRLNTTNLFREVSRTVKDLFYAKNTGGTVTCEALGSLRFFNTGDCQRYVSQNRTTLSPKSTTCYVNKATCEVVYPTPTATP